VVIPARDEAATVGAIVRAFARSPAIGRVIVVDDGLDDDGTAEAARVAGATVVQGPRLGKGQAMARGLALVQTGRVVFCDADLAGLTTAHVNKVAAPYHGMVLAACEFNDPGFNDPGFPAVRRTQPPGELSPYNLSGVRCLPAWIPRGIDLHGYLAEIQIHQVSRPLGLWVRNIWLDGVTNPPRQGAGPATPFYGSEEGAWEWFLRWSARIQAGIIPLPQRPGAWTADGGIARAAR
jgi:glycosyltransferase involved in cell wall biosynthesis